MATLRGQAPAPIKCTRVADAVRVDVMQGLGGYRWSDFLRIGLLPLVLAIVVGLVAIALTFPLVHP